MNLNFSSVEWGPVAGQLMKIGAPLVGTLIGGPAGAIAGSIIGSLASALGTDPTPEALSSALQTPEGQAAAVNFEQDNRARLEVEVEKTKQTQIEQSNLSLRAEITSGDRFQRYARPLNMYAVGGVTGAYGICIVIATLDGIWHHNYEGLKTLMAEGPSLALVLSPAGAVAGVTAWQQTKEKLAGVIQRAPSPKINAVKR